MPTTAPVKGLSVWPWDRESKKAEIWFIDPSDVIEVTQVIPTIATSPPPFRWQKLPWDANTAQWWRRSAKNWDDYEKQAARF